MTGTGVRGGTRELTGIGLGSGGSVPVRLRDVGMETGPRWTQRRRLRGVGMGHWSLETQKRRSRGSVLGGLRDVGMGDLSLWTQRRKSGDWYPV